MATMTKGEGGQASTELTKLYEEGKRCLRERELKKACRLFTRAIAAYAPQVDTQDDLAVVYCARAQAHLGLDKTRESLLDAEECVRLRPHWSKVTTVQGTLSYSQLAPWAGSL